MPETSAFKHTATVFLLAEAMERAAETVMIVSPPEPEPSPPPDAALIRYCAELATNNATRARVLAILVRTSRRCPPSVRAEMNAQLGRLAATWRDLLERIGDTPATTLEGCRAKARAVRILFDETPEPRTARTEVAASLAADLLALANDGAR